MRQRPEKEREISELVGLVRVWFRMRIYYLLKVYVYTCTCICEEQMLSRSHALCGEQQDLMQKQRGDKDLISIILSNN